MAQIKFKQDCIVVVDFDIPAFFKALTIFYTVYRYQQVQGQNKNAVEKYTIFCYDKV